VIGVYNLKKTESHHQRHGEFYHLCNYVQRITLKKVQSVRSMDLHRPTISYTLVYFDNLPA